ncbi:hypothetical protein [Flavobacterium sp.]|uniref:hypothetical protein n=1 Tax=Flavobacterium sp. TaxID=239 RepID=UPI003753107D
MKRLLTNLFLFGIVFFVIDKFFYVFLFTSPNLEVDKRLELLINGKINKDIIVMGSSRGAYGIIAGQIEKETSLSAYNITYPGSNIEFHEFLLKTLLKFNKKPKIIILPIDDPSELVFDKTLNFRFERLYPLVKYNYITNELINQKEKNQLARVLCLARLNRGNFSFEKKKISSESPILECGSMPFINQINRKKFNFYKHLKKYNIKNEKESKIKAFLEFQDICNKNNIKLIYCFTPNFRPYNTDLEKRIKKISDKENKFFVYDTLNQLYKKEDYFYDESHLNIKGAKLYTTELSNFINLNKN